MLNQAIDKYLLEVKQKGLFRDRKLSSDLIHFDSNDYLSLSQDKELSLAYQQGFQTYANGSGGSMLLSGYHKAHHELEEAFAQWLGVDACMLFSSGYCANLAVTALLGKLKAFCLIDKRVHASIYDGMALSKVAFERYRDVEDLGLKVQANALVSAIYTEGIFSMGGQPTPLNAIYNLGKNKISLLVDEAHSIGILGQEGKGATDSFGLSQTEVPLRIIPLGKAFASQGAIVAGQNNWIKALLQVGRSIIYSTATMPALSVGLLKTLEFVAKAEDRRNTLKSHIAHFKECIKGSPLCFVDSTTPIQYVELGCPQRALYYAQELKKQGFSCSAIRAPTVTPKASGLRIVLNYKHKPFEISQLIHSIHQIYELTSY